MARKFDGVRWIKTDKGYSIETVPADKTATPVMLAYVEKTKEGFVVVGVLPLTGVDAVYPTMKAACEAVAKAWKAGPTPQDAMAFTPAGAEEGSVPLVTDEPAN